MASLEEMREENLMTPPAKNVIDTCAIVVRDKRRVKIEELDLDRMERIGGTEDDPENLRSLFDLAPVADRVDRGVPPTIPPFHLNLYGGRDGYRDGDRLSFNKRVVVVDESGRAEIQTCMIPEESRSGPLVGFMGSMGSMRSRFSRDGHLGAVEL